MTVKDIMTLFKVDHCFVFATLYWYCAVGDSYSITQSSFPFMLTCSTGTLRITSLQHTVFQTCLWRSIWMRVPPETRPPLWSLLPHRCAQSAAVPQNLEWVKIHTYMCFFKVMILEWHLNILCIPFSFFISFHRVVFRPSHFCSICTWKRRCKSMYGSFSVLY